jgi:hypothetical protein
MELKNEIMSFLSTLTIQEKKQGYATILVNFLVDIRRGFFKEDDNRVLADILHNLPHFLGNDLVYFDEDLFWDTVLDHKLYSSFVFRWFLHGVPVQSSNYNFIKVMQRWDNEKAE